MNKYKKLIERVTIIGDKNEKTGEEVEKLIIEGGFKVVHVGPKRISKHKFDWDKIRYVLEREVGKYE